MKRNILIAILALVICIALAGCGNDKDSGSETEKPTSIVGSWECEDIAMTFNGEKADQELIETTFGEDYSSVLILVAYSDGSADMTLMDDEVSLSWNEENDNEYRLSSIKMESGEFDDMNAKLDGEKLIISTKETYYNNDVEETSEIDFTMKYLGDKSRLIDGWDVKLSDEEVYAMSNALSGGGCIEVDGMLYGDYGGKEWGGGAFTVAKIKDNELKDKKVIEKDVKVSDLTTYDGSIYGILDGKKIVKVEAGKTEANTLYEGDCDHLQVTDDGIYFTDKESKYCKVDLKGKNKETVLDKEVYYPYQVSAKFMVYQDDADDETIHVYNLKEKADTKLTEEASYKPLLCGEYIYFYTPGSDENLNHMCRINMYSGKEEKAEKESILYDYYLTPDNIIAATGGFVKLDYSKWDKMADQNNMGTEFYPVYSNGEIWITKSSGENFMGPKTFGTDDEKSIGYTYMTE